MNTGGEIIRRAKKILNFLEDIGDLTDIKFNLRQAHDLIGIKKNRIQYWTDKGYIKKINKEEKRYRYSPEKVRKILIINWLAEKDQENIYRLDAASEIAEKIVKINDKEASILTLTFLIWIFKSNSDQISSRLIESNLTDSLMEMLTHS